MFTEIERNTLQLTIYKSKYAFETPASYLLMSNQLIHVGMYLNKRKRRVSGEKVQMRRVRPAP